MEKYPIKLFLTVKWKFKLFRCLYFIPFQCTISKISHKLLHCLSGEIGLITVHVGVILLIWDIKYHQIDTIIKIDKVAQAVRYVISLGVEEEHRWLFHFEVVFSHRLDDLLSLCQRPTGILI